MAQGNAVAHYWLSWLTFSTATRRKERIFSQYPNPSFCQANVRMDTSETGQQEVRACDNLLTSWARSTAGVNHSSTEINKAGAIYSSSGYGP